jgi:signal transduction histidine kinase
LQENASDRRAGEVFPLTTVRLRHEYDVVLARQRARAIADLAGFESQDQVKFATSVSEIARNAFRYAGGGEVAFSIASAPNGVAPCNERRRTSRAPDGMSWWLIVRVSDSGQGIPNIDEVMDGTYVSSTGMGLGIVGARRLNDCFKLESIEGKGTVVELGRLFPRTRRSFSGSDAAAIAAKLAAITPNTPIEELEKQNQEILDTMEALREKQAAVEKLNSELAETNRGVLALYAELDDRAAELKRISDYKTRFLSDISHELRTPLTSVQNLTRILLARDDGELTDEQERQVTMIQKAADGLTDMVNELLDIARIEAGKIKVEPTECTVPELFGSVRGLVRPLVTNESVSLVIDEQAAEKIPDIYTDGRRLSQILRNFLSNAIKFTESGTVTLTAALEEGDIVRYSVTDTGVGIDAKDMQRIFEDFTQVDGPIQKRVRGSGLGLPLTKKLAALLGGTVEATSTPGAGSTFSALIPRVYRERSDDAD